MQKYSLVLLFPLAHLITSREALILGAMHKKISVSRKSLLGTHIRRAVASALPKDKHLSAVYKKSIFADDDDDSDDDAPEKIRSKDCPRGISVSSMVITQPWTLSAPTCLHTSLRSAGNTNYRE